jgi:putative addiction module CopG family antidote
MSASKVSLPPDLDDFVLTRLESGRYENANELLRAAMRALDREEKNAAQKLAVATIADGDVFRGLWEASNKSSMTLRS